MQLPLILIVVLPLCHAEAATSAPHEVALLAQLQSLGLRDSAKAAAALDNLGLQRFDDIAFYSATHLQELEQAMTASGVCLTDRAKVMHELTRMRTIMSSQNERNSTNTPLRSDPNTTEAADGAGADYGNSAFTSEGSARRRTQGVGLFGGCTDATGLSASLTDLSQRTAALELITHTAAAPYGTIVLWHGTKKDIPTGWVACDGTHDTPDLRDRFIVGAGKKYDVGADKEKGSNVEAGTSWSGGTGGPGHGQSTGSELHVNFGEPVPAYHALIFVMRRDVRCCICHCSVRDPARPVSVVVGVDQAPDAACEAQCKMATSCGTVGGSFAHKFC